MVLAKIYGVSSSYFTSLCGEDFLDCDGVLPSQENEFCDDDFLKVRLEPDSYGGETFNVRCRYFTTEEIKGLEAAVTKGEHKDSATSGLTHLHLVLFEDDLKRHGLTSGQMVDVEVLAMELSRVILSAKYDTNVVKDNGFLMQNFEYLICDQTEMSVGKKSVVDLQCRGITVKVELEAIKCELVSQGTVDPHTKWIILDTSNGALNGKVSLQNSSCLKTSTEEMLGGCSLQSLLITGFASPIKELLGNDIQDKTVQFKIEVDYWSDLHLSFINSIKNKWKLDENDTHCLYVSMETLLELGVQSGCWVTVWIHEGDSNISNDNSEIHGKLLKVDSMQTETEKVGSCSSMKCDRKLNGKTENHLFCHSAQVFAISPTEKALDIYFAQTRHVLDMDEFVKKTRKTVHISPLLLFNLLQITVGIPKSNELSLTLATELKRAVKQNSLNTTSMPFAQDAHLSLINTPFAKPGDRFDESLKRFFSKPRLLTVGDVLCVNYDSTKDSVNSLVVEECYYNTRTIYFKVKRLVVSGKDEQSCLADIDNTTVYQCLVFSEKDIKLDIQSASTLTLLQKIQHSSLVLRGTIYTIITHACKLPGRNVHCDGSPESPPIIHNSTSVHSCVPIDAQSVFSKNGKSNYWMSTSPPGLHEPTKELICIIKPYLKQHVNMMPAVLLTGPGGVGKGTIVMAIGRQFGLCVMNINCYDLIGESVAATESRISNIFQKAINCRPCILLLRNINILTKDRDGLEDEPRVANTLQQCIANLKQVTSWPVVVIATSSSNTPLSSQLYTCFLHEVNVPPPTESGRKQILEALASTCSVAQDVSFRLVSKRTAGLVLADLVSLLTKAANAACQRVSKQILGDFPHQERSIKCSTFESKLEEREGDDHRLDAKINQEDFEEAIEIIRAEHSDAIGAPKIPNVSWQDIGGLLDVKEELLDTIQLPLQHPDLFVSGLRRSGVLLYGPPGTGKTLLAKAVATECSLNFLSVKGPELINMYVGQSEQNVRQVFSRAQSATPCVIFFDELDSLAPNRGRSGDSGGVMDRVVSQLLAELDGLHKSCDVFVIGATNRPDLLDPALLRPGRFDKLLYLGISEDHEAQLKILKALTKKFDLDPDCNLEAISLQCPLNFTGADLYALCSDAMLHAIKRAVAEQTDVEKEVQQSVKVKEEDFLEALRYLTPSVPEQELQRYKKIQQQLSA